MPPIRNAQSTSASNAASRLAAYNSKSVQARKAERDQLAQIVPFLANRAYHLPGNSYFQDWRQYFLNNHPVLGICCSNRLHPMTTCTRVIMLIGSLCSGLVITNFVYLWFLQYAESGINQEFISVQINFANSTNWNSQKNGGTHGNVSVSNQQIFLWTVGGALHSIFDLSLWFLCACVCCLPGGCMEFCGRWRWLGSYVVIFTVIVVTAIASFAVVLRATLAANSSGATSQDLHSAGIFDDQIQLGDTNANSFHFLITWLIEVALALFFYNPIIGTIFFTGVLGCGRLPFLGGRPREMKLEERATLRATATEQDENDLDHA